MGTLLAPYFNCRTLGEARHRLGELQRRLAHDGDDGAYYLAICSHMTDRLAQVSQAALDDTHPDHSRLRHLDGRLIEGLALALRNRYFKIQFLASSGQLTRLPLPWQVTFSCGRQRTNPTLTLILGLISYVCFEYPLALVGTRQGVGRLYRPGYSRHAHTLDALNDQFCEALPDIMALLHEVDNLRPAHRNRCALLRLDSFGLRTWAFWIVRTLLQHARREGRWHAICVIRGQLTEVELARIIARRQKRLIQLRFGHHAKVP